MSYNNTGLLGIGFAIDDAMGETQTLPSVIFKYPFSVDDTNRQADLLQAYLELDDTNLGSILLLLRTTQQNDKDPATNAPLSDVVVFTMEDCLRFVFLPLRLSSQVSRGLQMFTVVFVLNASYDSILEASKAKLHKLPSPTEYGEYFNGSLLYAYQFKHLLPIITKSLVEAENRDGYLTTQSRLIARSVSLQEKASFHLSRQLMLLFDGLQTNGQIDLPFPLCLSISLKGNENEFATLSPTLKLRPYHSLVTLHQDVEEEKMLNPKLLRVFRYFVDYGATKSLANASEDLSTMSLKEIFIHANHLRFWKYVRVVSSLQLYSIIRVKQSLNTSILPKLAKQFSLRFANERMDLYTLVSIISENGSLQIVLRKIKIKNPETTEQASFAMISFALEHNVISQLNQFVFFVPPDDFTTVDVNNNKSSNNEKLINNNKHESPTSSKKLQKISQMLKPNQYKYLMSLEKGDEIYSWLLSAIIYFNGEFSIEEICYLTQLSFVQLQAILDKYQDVLFLSVFED